MSFCTFWDTFLGFDNFLVYASLYFFITVRWWIIWSQENIRRLRRTFFSNTLSLAKCHLSNNIQINTCIIITSYNNSVQTFSAFFHCMYSNPFLPKFWHVYIVGPLACIFCTLFFSHSIYTKSWRVYLRRTCSSNTISLKYIQRCRACNFCILVFFLTAYVPSFVVFMGH